MLEDVAYPDGPLRGSRRSFGRRISPFDDAFRSRRAIKRLSAATLSIYEYRHATRADAGATLDIARAAHGRRHRCPPGRPDPTVKRLVGMAALALMS